MIASRLSLSINQQMALEFLKKELVKRNYSIEEYIIFGSVARGEAEAGSDLDVLALSSKPISHKEKHNIYGIVTEINLKYDTNLSILLIDKAGWSTGLYSILSIKDEIERDGVRF